MIDDYTTNRKADIPERHVDAPDPEAVLGVDVLLSHSGPAFNVLFDMCTLLGQHEATAGSAARIRHYLEDAVVWTERAIRDRKASKDS